VFILINVEWGQLSEQPNTPNNKFHSNFKSRTLFKLKRRPLYVTVCCISKYMYIEVLSMAISYVLYMVEYIV